MKVIGGVKDKEIYNIYEKKEQLSQQNCSL